MATLTLPPLKWEFTQSRKVESFPINLGDNYSIIGTVPNSDRLTWNLTFPGLDYTEADDLVDLFSSLKGSEIFQWTPVPNVPVKDYVCTDWSVSKQGVDVVQITATFLEIR
jgi:phage-related protein